MDAATVATAITGLIIAIGTVATAIGSNRQANLKATLDALQNSVKLLSDENGRMAKRLEQWEERTREQEDDHAKELEAKEKENDKCKERIAALESKVAQIQQDRKTTERERDALQVQIQNLEAEVVNLRTQIVELGGKPKTGPLTSRKDKDP